MRFIKTRLRAAKIKRMDNGNTKVGDVRKVLFNLKELYVFYKTAGQKLVFKIVSVF